MQSTANNAQNSPERQASIKHPVKQGGGNDRRVTDRDSDMRMSGDKPPHKEQKNKEHF